MAKIFGSALLQPARSVCVSLSVFLLEILRYSYGLWTISCSVDRMQNDSAVRP